MKNPPFLGIKKYHGENPMVFKKVKKTEKRVVFGFF
jgi:hypothetical protein